MRWKRRKYEKLEKHPGRKDDNTGGKGPGKDMDKSKGEGRGKVRTQAGTGEDRSRGEETEAGAGNRDIGAEGETGRLARAGAKGVITISAHVPPSTGTELRIPESQHCFAVTNSCEIHQQPV